MWLVLGADYLPIGPIDEFLTFHDITGSSPNTIRAYAHHLKLYWEYLTDAQLDRRSATLQDVVTFVAWLRWGSLTGGTPHTIGERRKPSSINAIVAAVMAFRVYHARAGRRLPRSTTNPTFSRVDATSRFFITSPGQADPEPRGQAQQPRSAAQDAQRR
jgi:hypothetical protein